MHNSGAVAFVGVMAVISLLAALLVYSGRPRHAMNRLLALALFFQASAGAIRGLTLLHDVPSRVGGDAVGLSVVFFVAALSWIMLYLLFLGTLRTPVSWPLRTRTGRFLIIGYWTVVGAWAILWPVDFVTPNTSAPPSPFITVPVLVVSIWGLLVAIQMWQRSTPLTLERRQATAFLVAFGIRDLSLAIFGGFAIAALFGPVSSTAASVLPPLPSVANLVSALLLTYGILSTQLLDIDLKIKWGIRRGTLLTIFVAAFLATTEIVSEVVTNEQGIWVGLAVTMMLVLALGPLQRVADKVADRAMPGVHDTPEYRSLRRTEIYEAAVRSALVDGVVTDREQDVLATLADKLALTSVEVLAVERSILQTEAPQ